MSARPVSPTRSPWVRTPPAHATAAEARAAAESRYWNLPRVSILVAAALMWLLHMTFVGFDLARFFLSTGVIVVLPATLGAVVVLVWSRPWAYLTGGLLVILFPVMAILGGAMANIANPALGIDSIANLLALLLLAAALPAAIIGFRQARRGALRPLRVAFNGSPHGVYSWVLLALFVGALAQSMLATNAANDAAALAYDFQPAATIEVVMEDLEFRPDAIAVPADAVVLLRVENQDATFHTFTYARDGVEYDHDIVAGDTTEFLVLFEEPGTYMFWCVPHTDGRGDDRRGMIGTFEVT